MRRALLVHEHPDVWLARQQRTRGTRVVEVNVRHQQGGDVGQRGPHHLQLTFERRQAAGRAGIDQRQSVRALQETGRDDARESLEREVDVRDA